jgi:hypothetical protein
VHTAQVLSRERGGLVLRGVHSGRHPHHHQDDANPIPKRLIFVSLSLPSLHPAHGPLIVRVAT